MASRALSVGLPAMGYRFSPPVYACAPEPDRLVLLRVDTDRYLGMPDGVTRLLHRRIKNPERDRDKRLDRLVEAGLLTYRANTTDTLKLTRHARPSHEFDQDQVVFRPAGPLSLAKALLAYRNAACRLRTHGIAAVLTGAPLTKACPEPNGGAAARVAQALMARSMLAWRAQCLRDTLALRLMLAPMPTTLVVGVRLSPFAAHCWLEAGSMVLNDEIEAVARFEPILVA